MGHTSLATSNAICFKQTHLCPTKAKAEPDRIVNFVSRGNSVIDQPQSLAPDRFQKAVGNECLDLFSDMQGVHANRRVK